MRKLILFFVSAAGLWAQAQGSYSVPPSPGPSGATGASGATGSAGATGATGPTGAAGSANVTTCGTTSTCANTAVATPRIVFGSVALVSGTPSTVTVSSISPAFTSTSSYICVVSAQSGAASALLSVANVSSSSFTITGPATATTVINFNCSGN